MKNKESFSTLPLSSHELERPDRTPTQERFNATTIRGREGDTTSSYNKYSIGSKELVFRSYNELPPIDGPAKWLNKDDVSAIFDSGPDNASNIVNAEQEDAILVVPTSPEGMISAIQEVSGNNHELADLLDADGKLNTSERSKIFLDSMIASVMYDDNYNERTRFSAEGAFDCSDNGDGFAVFVAAMSGDSESMQMLDKKLSKYYEDFDAAQTDREQEIAHEQSMLESKGLLKEPIPKNEVLLVHSTQHEIERDENGNITLYAAATKREDRLPRSSVHFTANGEVESHSMGQWNNENRLIVANFEDVQESNGNPRMMSEVDTWYTLNPREGITLPNARVVEPSQLEEGLLLEKHGDTYKYHQSDSYTPSQIEQIKQLADQYNIIQRDNYTDLLREVSLRAAGEELGIKEYVRIQSHYSADQDFNDRYASLAREIGVKGGDHDSSAEGLIEPALWGASQRFRPSLKASLEANRTLAWSGSISARVSEQKDQYMPAGFGGGLI